MLDHICAICNRFKEIDDGQTEIGTILSSHNSYLSVVYSTLRNFCSGMMSMGTSDNDTQDCWPSCRRKDAGMEDINVTTHDSHRRLIPPFVW
jgi:hypothetical protein